MASLYLNTVAAGAFALAATWDLAAVPEATDRVKINHAVTLSDTRVIGTSPGASDGSVVADLALEVAQAGSLTASAGAELVLRGPARVSNTSNATTNLDAVVFDGATLTFDATSAADPSTAKYGFSLGSATFCYRRLVTKNGAVIRSAAGGANGYVRGQTGGNGACLDLSNTLVQRVGDAATPAFSAAYQYSSATAASRVSLVDVELDTTGGIKGAGNVSGSITFRLQRVTLHNTLGAVALDVAGGSAANTLFDDCHFDKLCKLNSLACTWTNTTQYGGVQLSGTWPSGANAAVIADSLYYQPNGAVDLYAMGYRRDRCAHVITRTAANHKMTQQFLSRDDYNGIIEPLGTAPGGGDGEYSAGAGLSNGTVVRYFNCVFLPTPDGRGQRWGEILNNTTGRMEFYHCTGPYYNAVFGGGHNANNGSDGTDRIRAKSNLMYQFADPSAIGLTNSSPSKVGPISYDRPDTWDPTQFAWNAAFAPAGRTQMVVGRNLQGYDTANPGGTSAGFGANDFDGVDPKLKMAPGGGVARAWTYMRDVAGLSTATYTSVQMEDMFLAALAARNLVAGKYGRTADHPDRIAAVKYAGAGGYWAFVFDGIKTQSAAFRDYGSHDGATPIGAGAYEAPQFLGAGVSGVVLGGAGRAALGMSAGGRAGAVLGGVAQAVLVRQAGGRSGVVLGAAAQAVVIAAAGGTSALTPAEHQAIAMIPGLASAIDALTTAVNGSAQASSANAGNTQTKLDALAARLQGVQDALAGLPGTNTVQAALDALQATLTTTINTRAAATTLATLSTGLAPVITRVPQLPTLLEIRGDRERSGGPVLDTQAKAAALRTDVDQLAADLAAVRAGAVPLNEVQDAAQAGAAAALAADGGAAAPLSAADKAELVGRMADAALLTEIVHAGPGSPPEDPTQGGTYARTRPSDGTPLRHVVKRDASQNLLDSRFFLPDGTELVPGTP